MDPQQASQTATSPARSEAKGKEIMSEKLERSVTMKMDDAVHCNDWRKQTCSIFRVPVHLRWSHLEVYNPKMISNGPYDPKYVSIGPYHRGIERLQPMEEFKWRALHMLIESSKTPTKDSHGASITVKDCIHKMNELEESARSCYSGKIEMSSEDFVQMMLLDGCFIIMVLIDRLDELAEKRHGQGGGGTSEVLFNNVMTDLLMLENQLPFFILCDLFDLLRCGGTIVKHALAILLDAYPGYKYYDDYEGDKEVYHLLHLFCLSIVHPLLKKTTTPTKGPTKNIITMMANKFEKKVKSVLPDWCSGNLLPRFTKKNMNPAGPTKNSKWIPSVTELEGFGVKFKSKDAFSFMDVTFRDGVMEIPTLMLYPYTKTIFHNILAFELCSTTEVHRPQASHLSHYVILMDFLIGNKNDIDALQEKEIIINWLGSQDEVVRIFNQLRLGVVDFSDDSFSSVYRDVNIYRRRNWHQWWAKLKRQYFSNPWSIISLGAAILLLLLSFVQTFFSMSPVLGILSSRT